MDINKRSRPMTTAAVILSIISMSTVCCIYSSLICGALGIIFALLSKGGEWTMSPQAKTAFTVSLLAVILTLGLTIGSFALIIMQYGSFDAFWNEYMQMMEAYTSSMTCFPFTFT